MNTNQRSVKLKRSERVSTENACSGAMRLDANKQSERYSEAEQKKCVECGKFCHYLIVLI